MLCGETAVMAQASSYAQSNDGYSSGAYAFEHQAVWDAAVLQRHVHPGDGFDRSSKVTYICPAKPFLAVCKWLL